VSFSPFTASFCAISPKTTKAQGASAPALFSGYEIRHNSVFCTERKTPAFCELAKTPPFSTASVKNPKGILRYCASALRDAH